MDASRCIKDPMTPISTLTISCSVALWKKQELINTQLQDNSPVGVPAVIPVIGAYRVGKKSPVACACNDDTVRSHFSSVLHLKSNDFMKVISEWIKFYSAISHMGASGTKVIIIRRFQEVSRFGTVKPILLKSLSEAEFPYLFKVLAFGETDPENHHN